MNFHRECPHGVPSDTCPTCTPPTRTVIIPACVEHNGFHAMTVTLPWLCLKCGGPRGEPVQGLSYDGSRRLAVHLWENPCGHVELYSEVRAAIAAAMTGHPVEAAQFAPGTILP